MVKVTIGLLLEVSLGVRRYEVRLVKQIEMDFPPTTGLHFDFPEIDSMSGAGEVTYAMDTREYSVEFREAASIDWGSDSVDQFRQDVARLGYEIGYSNLPRQKTEE